MPKTSKPKLDIETVKQQYTYESCCGCEMCGLCTDRNQIVWHRGYNEKRIMIVGEAPGYNEDKYGLPFVGDSGKLLQNIFASVGLNPQDDCYICNVVKCRPKDNRQPTAGEVSKCLPYLLNQIVEAQPRVIVTMGAVAGKALIDEKPFSVTKLRGKVFDLKAPLKEIIISNYNFIEHIKILLTLHPAALLRENTPKMEPGSNRWLVWQDMQKLKAMLE